MREGSSIAATKASAVNWPTPGIVISRLQAGEALAIRYKGQLKLKDWAFAIAKRSTMRKARVALARRLEIIMHAMLRDGTEFEIGLAPALDKTGGRI